MSAAHRSAVIARRGCALVALGSAGLHLTSLGHATVSVSGVLLAMMVAGCVFCTRELWVVGSLRAWLVVALMNIAMIALHLPAPTHHHGGSAATDASLAMSLATLLALVEVCAAAAVLYVRTRRLGAALDDDRRH
ncbi:hypothetical protein [Mycolicibacterium litorale]|uniref:Uncharacterized protein n=1 Tax=Mycolicibacterium litorale TaxID=758802 RepID=A0AAD1IR67_9MYCO|nr:hypothetical protein [Mycolicibacterium litorale]MCV7418347.1 hypothetical protein [Mycolicibacterium litorale]TDY06258.1 hypothetical protein BCL50_2576 [Mycolicibacterium litorale]BBY19596.1 hypothetical protein MLIT_51880 [Mycolicibacterium litorale]